MGFNSAFKGLISRLRTLKIIVHHHHHHVQEGLGLIPVPCILKMKLVPTEKHAGLEASRWQPHH